MTGSAERAAMLPSQSRTRPWRPGRSTPVIPAARVDAAYRGPVPVFGEERWTLEALGRTPGQPHRVITFADFPVGYRQTAKHYIWALCNIATPDALMHNRRPVRRYLSAGSVEKQAHDLRLIVKWMQSAGSTTLPDVSVDLLEEFAVHAARTWRPAPAQAMLRTLERLWAYASYLPKQHRLTAQPPWVPTGAGSYVRRGPRGINTTEPIHPATMGPLLVWALRFVQEFAGDILAASGERQRISANTPNEPCGPAYRRRVVDYFQALARAGDGLPHTRGHVAAQYIAGQLGVPVAQVRDLSNRHPDAAKLPPVPAVLPVPIRGGIHGHPWLAHIEWSASDYWLRLLQISCFIVIDYLSGLRPHEALALRRGCVSTADADPAGALRYELRGREFKGMVDDQGNQLVPGRERRHPWTVVEPVADAVAVCERMAPGDELFTVPGTRLLPHMGTLLTVHDINRWLPRLIDTCNELAAAHQRPEEQIPDDPAGPVTVRRFRRTLAWFISRQPAGTVALGVQYGHLRLSASEGYGARSHGLADLLDVEESRMMADTLHTVAEALTAGERISGPAAPRLVAAAAEFDERYGGKMLTERQYRALRRHSPLQVFDNPAQFLICNYDPLQLRPATRALCEDRRLHCQRANPRPGRLPTRLRQHCPNRHSHPRPTGPCARVAGPSRLGTAARAHASAAPSTDRPP